ncbi:MAG: hypothetical protein PG980_000735 [Wolbachia endosymbiont of Ctenocephalides felis wCfeJ]|nr:MAG: hypothetical protein PG980_000735 [Wolbachia endosymbiont of Ctenocephalides felis wCfeJ]
MNIRDLLFSILRKNENKALSICVDEHKNLLFSILYKNENKALSICVDEHKNLLFSILRKSENKAYLNGNRLLVSMMSPE